MIRKEPNVLVNQSKLFDTIVRHSIEIRENDVMTYLTLKNVILLLPNYHEQRLLNSQTLSGISNPRPVLTPGTANRAVSSGTPLTVIFKFAF